MVYLKWFSVVIFINVRVRFLSQMVVIGTAVGFPLCA